VKELSKSERNRIKTRVRTAMAAQAQLEGRYLGGRPLYGYMLIDTGPQLDFRRGQDVLAAPSHGPCQHKPRDVRRA
jgi:DNA invertase Pin-like site-specific DNA recombinase